MSSSTGVPLPYHISPLSLWQLANRMALVAAFNYALNMVQSRTQKSKETTLRIMQFLRKATDSVCYRRSAFALIRFASDL